VGDEVIEDVDDGTAVLFRHRLEAVGHGFTSRRCNH
jgi:hypothetical protein